MQIHIYHGKIDMTDNGVQLIFKFKQYKNANTAYFMYCGKNLNLRILITKEIEVNGDAKLTYRLKC